MEGRWLNNQIKNNLCSTDNRIPHMSFFKNLFKKNEPVKTYADFWAWFRENAPAFYEVVKNNRNPEKDFIGKLSPKLDALKDGIAFLAGMDDENTAELIFTPDGIIKNIVFAEELVHAAPSIPNWKFTALKPATDLENIQLEMAGYTFHGENLSFYPVVHAHYPDEIDIAIVHPDYTEKDKTTLSNGTFLFMDHYLGELNSVSIIDNATVISGEQAEQELIPIAKLKDYLVWREKEFVEKYQGLRYDTEQDTYASMQATLSNGKPLLAIINTTLLDWDSKASHPWILTINLSYRTRRSDGFPEQHTYDQLTRFEEEMMQELKDSEGYLNIGRFTADGEREIYVACRDFRKPSRVTYDLAARYADKFTVTYDIYKDKYWQSLEKFRGSQTE